MSGNTESTANSIKFEPMPMSALLASLMPLQSQPDSRESSFEDIDDSDNSFGETVSKKPSPKKRNNFLTPNLKVSRTVDIKSFASEKKPSPHDYNKENKEIKQDPWTKNQIHASSKETVIQNRTPKQPPPDVINVKQRQPQQPSPKKKSVLVPQNNNLIPPLKQGSYGSAHKRTPEISKQPPSAQKVKTATPKIKSGIRKFTPGSARSQKKPIQLTLQSRDKVRCELFSHNQSKEQTKDEMPRPPPRQDPPHSVPETPLNKKSMPVSYAATPSYPQGLVGHNSKILFKTTSIKDKKYLFIKKLGTGGSSEVYKVLEVGTSSEYAVKCVYLATDQELAQGYVNEVRLLRELQDSDRVIKLYDYEYDRSKQTLRMVLEVGETDLASFLRARGTGLPPALVLHYWEEMLLAVQYIHEHVYECVVLQGCTCTDACAGGCACTAVSVSRWYAGGRLRAHFPLHDAPAIFECNATCRCNPKRCSNNPVSRLLKRGSVWVRCEVYRAGGARGWGLRCCQLVRRGTPVAAYTGELLLADDADRRATDHYMFAIDVKPDLLEQCVDKRQFCVDASQYGGAARFMNHSCRPTLAPLRVLTTTRDLRLPTIALFATADLPPNTPLTFDYGDKFWSVKSKYMSCECGEPNCRYPTKSTEEIES